jgi:hypothetical protein
MRVYIAPLSRRRQVDLPAVSPELRAAPLPGSARHEVAPGTSAVRRGHAQVGGGRADDRPRPAACRRALRAPAANVVRGRRRARLLLVTWPASVSETRPSGSGGGCGPEGTNFQYQIEVSVAKSARRTGSRWPKPVMCRQFPGTERRRSRTYPAWGCHASPVVKTVSNMPICRHSYGRAPVRAPVSRRRYTKLADRSTSLV